MNFFIQRKFFGMSTTINLISKKFFIVANIKIICRAIFCQIFLVIYVKNKCIFGDMSIYKAYSIIKKDLTNYVLLFA